MVKTKCLLGNEKPQCCKDFPRKQSDIDECGRLIGEESICVAEIGGMGCNQCGQCCRNKPFIAVEGIEWEHKGWLNENGECIYLVE